MSTAEADPSAKRGEAAVRTAFRSQADWCRRLGSPFTARLCEAIGTHLDRASPVGRAVLDWPGEPDARHDGLPLRLCGGLHALVRAGRLPGLAPLYPPGPVPDEGPLRAALEAAFEDAETDLLAWLDLPPQTNEVARSAVLIAGLAVASERTGGRPVRLYELGASAGLNLLLDRYESRLGGRVFGTPGSPVRLEPAWSGPPPPQAAIRVCSRQGVDLHPLDVAQPRDRERLLAYVWADQTERLRRLAAALELAKRDPPAVEAGDAAEWVERRLGTDPPRGETRVVLHSIAFQYFPAAAQARIAAHLERTGAAATPDAPLAWLRFEVTAGGPPALALRLWPGGRDAILARADPHGRWVDWRGG